MLGQLHGFEILQFRAEHIKVEELRDHERTFLTSFGDMGGAKLKMLENSGPGWSVFKGEKFIAAGGVVPLFGGTAEIWQFPTRWIPDFTCSYCKVFKSFVEELNEEYSRLQTIALDDELHNRWMSFLEFQKEGVMMRYGYDQQNYAMFARLK